MKNQQGNKTGKPRTITHVDDPEIPEGCSITFLSGEPNPEGLQAVMDSLDKFIIKQRIKNDPTIPPAEGSNRLHIGEA